MTLKELMESPIIKDDTKITVVIPITGFGADTKEGNWFHDQILAFQAVEIDTFYWSERDGVSVALK